MEQRSVAASPIELADEQLAFFRWGRAGGKVAITNDAGDWALLSEAELADLLAGRISDSQPRFAELQRKGFLRDGLDVDGLVQRIARRNRHISRGPHLHVLTLDGPSGPMAHEVLERIVDLALESASQSLTFDLQASTGEPLRQWDLVRAAVETARSRNQQSAGKTLAFRVFSNLSAMTDATASWLIDNQIRLAVDLDGPANLHDAQRNGGASHADTVRWIEHFHQAQAQAAKDEPGSSVEACVNVSSATLAAPQAVLDEYERLGLPLVALRPARSGAPAAESYLSFHRALLEDLRGRNRRGSGLAEQLAAVIATKILTADDPGAVDLQSPNGAGTNELSYASDGTAFPCDLARQLAVAGDAMFALGNVRSLSLPDILRHPTVRAIAAASLLDLQPATATAWEKPFIGMSPVAHYAAQGDLFGQPSRCFECRLHRAVTNQLFEWLAEDGGDAAEILGRWVVSGSSLAVSRRASSDMV
ncbi:MAG TPA: hypothetical protein VEB21_21375 [Terriglobales bacterium]|nr:hypothetical protein [Terriglobales bacterium]